VEEGEVVTHGTIDEKWEGGDPPKKDDNCTKYDT
jgi:hypothetical protein